MRIIAILVLMAAACVTRAAVLRTFGCGEEDAHD